MVLDDIRNNKVFLVIVTKDLLLNTKKTLTDKTSFYNVPILFDFDQELLNKSIGKSMIKVIGIKDKNAASKIISMQKV